MDTERKLSGGDSDVYISGLGNGRGNGGKVETLRGQREIGDLALSQSHFTSLTLLSPHLK